MVNALFKRFSEKTLAILIMVTKVVTANFFMLYVRTETSCELIC